MSTDPIAAPAEESHGTTSETLLAVRNAFKLGASLLGTWGISLAIQLLLPRFLGPEQFGPLTFAESFTTTAFIVLGLGLDTYIRKEIPVRPQHASDFFGVLLSARLLAWVALMGLMALFLHATNRPPEVHTLVYIYGAAQLAYHIGENLKALLHSIGTVDGLSIANVVFKCMWGAGVLASVALFNGSLVGVALSLLVSRTLELSVLWVLTRRHLGLKLRFSDWGALKLVVVGSLPFYLNTVAYTFYNKVDLTILTLMSNDVEAGWYGAAAKLGEILMMIAPMIGWVMMPLFARAYHRSKEEFTSVLRRALELILALSIPLSLAVALGADILIHFALGDQYLPATRALQVLAPINTLIYVSIICATTLNIMNHAWRVTLLSLGGMVVNPVLNFLLVPFCLKWLGPSGGGVGCALAQFITQASVTVVMVWMMGRTTFDQRTVVMLLKSLGVCAVVVALDRLIRDVGMIRILIDGVAYLALILLVRAVPLRETLDFARRAFRREPA